MYFLVAASRDLAKIKGNDHCPKTPFSELNVYI